MPANQDPWVVAVIIAGLGFLIGLSKAGFGGLGTLLTPLLSLVLPVNLAVGVLLPMLMVGDAFALYTYWREWDGGLVRRMLPAGIVGALAGTALLAWLPVNTLRVALALFVVLVVAYRYLGERLEGLRYAHRPWHAPAAGVLAGVASGMFNSGGPAANAFLLLQKLPPRVFTATGALFFALLNVVKVPGFLYTGVLDVARLMALWWVFLFIPLGIWAARVAVVRLRPQAFEGVVVALLLFSSGWLLWQSR